MNNIGKLLLGTGLSDLAGPLETIASGRKLARHSSGMGTVMEFNDGKPRRVLILDAQYRTTKIFGVYGIDSGLTKYNKYGYLNIADKFSPTTVAASATMGDYWINANILKDTNTAKQNCDVLVECKNPVAVSYCRSINVNGTPCDLPNIQTLARIYCDANAIDARDPSKDTNRTSLLGDLNSHSAWFIGPNTSPYRFRSWSSTNHSDTESYFVDKDGKVSYNERSSSYGFSVIPVLEL